MRYFLLVLVLFWAAVLPPFFTRGACDAQYDEEMAAVKMSRKEFASPDLASRYWRSRAIPVSTYPAEQCRHLALKNVDSCGSGSLVYVAIPVKNRICSFYRDASITVQLAYNSQGGLERIQTDMAPFKELDLPFLAKPLYWGK